MTRDEALEALKSSDLHTRLQAARLLAQTARAQDVAILKHSLSREKVVWVRTALRQAIARSSAFGAPQIERQDLGDIVPSEIFDQIRTIAVNETTNRIVHEIAPILGILRTYAKDEISDFEKSKTKTQLDRLGDLLHAIDRLSKAAVAPSLQEFDLSEHIRRIADSEMVNNGIRIDLAGPNPLLVIGDASLVEIALANGIRNAIEAVKGLYGESNESLPPIVINWGETDRDIWIAILDKGPGPPSTVERAFEIGNTTKENHLGMGLPTALQAVKSMLGKISLSLRSESGGARFEFSWPKTRLSDE
ncbi:HAMP domain-containing histidine kinase [bacterium]|nr:HAMP domain-containing histidine kinase [bacterium]